MLTLDLLGLLEELACPSFQQCNRIVPLLFELFLQTVDGSLLTLQLTVLLSNQSTIVIVQLIHIGEA